MKAKTLDQAITTLTLAVMSAERRGKQHLVERASAASVADADTDHITAVAGDISDAIEHIVPGLGMRFMQALHPHLDLTLDLEVDLFEEGLLAPAAGLHS